MRGAGPDGIYEEEESVVSSQGSVAWSTSNSTNHSMLPETFSRTIIELHGETGRAWLNCLPALIDLHARRWSLTVNPPFHPLSHNYVAPAIRSDGLEVVLKAGVPGPELFAEMDALALYDGRGMVQLLECSRDEGVMLLERLKPGTPLVHERDDRDATSIAAAIMRQLWRPLPQEHSFPTVSAWAMGLQRLRERFEGGTGPFPARLVTMAERLFTELQESAADPVLLHGDLHHWNIVAAERQPWLALDPKGVAGEPAYEPGAMLRNPWPDLLKEPYPGRILARRADQFADELGLDRGRITGWAIAQAVLSAWWSLEDHGRGWEWWIECADLISHS